MLFRSFFMDLENSKRKREELRDMLAEARSLLTGGLAACYGGGDGFSRQLARDMGRRRLAAAVDILGKYLLRCGYNIGVGHLTGALAAELTETRQ